MKRFEYLEIEYSHYPSPEELIHVFPTKKKFWNSDYEYNYTKEIYKATFKREF